MPVGLVAAFLAGVLSISSPCVLPLVPLYLAHLAGVGGPGQEPDRRTVLIHALAFVLGFGMIFVLFGISLGALGGVFLAYRDLLVRHDGHAVVAEGGRELGLAFQAFLSPVWAFRGIGAHAAMRSRSGRAWPSRSARRPRSR